MRQMRDELQKAKKKVEKLESGKRRNSVIIQGLPINTDN